MRLGLLLPILLVACRRDPPTHCRPRPSIASHRAPALAVTTHIAVTPTRTEAWTAAFRMKTRASDFEPAPDVVVHCPAGFDPARPLHLVVVFHDSGHSALVVAGNGLPDPVTGRPVVGWGLDVRHDMASTNTLLVALQLDDRPGHARLGRFAQHGFLGRFLNELLSDTLVSRLGRHSLADVDGMTLVGSSAGGPSIVNVLALRDLEDICMMPAYFDKVLEGLDLPPRVPDPDPKAPRPGEALQRGELHLRESAQGTLDASDAHMVDGSSYEDRTLVLGAGQRVTLALSGGRTHGYLCNRLDVELRVLDGATVLADDDDSGGELRSQVEFTAPHAGTYTVRVMTHGPWSNYGPWRLTVGP